MSWNNFLNAFTCWAGRDLDDIRHEFSRKRSIHNVEKIPESPGVYIISSDDCGFIYPRKNSKVFYIGETSDLFKRISRHAKNISDTANDERKGHHLYWPIYEYGGAFGANVSFCEHEDSKDLEGKLLERFARFHGTIPVANVKHSSFWDRVRAE